MTISLFLTLIVTLATAVSLLTEAVKKSFEGTKIKYSSNVVVLIVSVIVGIGGTALTYMFWVFLLLPLTLFAWCLWR